MEREEIEFALNALSGKQRTFFYFKDRYAAQLLQYYLGGSAEPVRSVKASSFGKLLAKPLLAQAINGSNDVAPSKLCALWPFPFIPYVVTLGQWPNGYPARFDRWGQTSRSGYNLVLQLNFAGDHVREYLRLMPDGTECPFDNDSHPISRNRHTIAWARIDYSFETGEALIEEIQSDWIRNVYDTAARLERFFEHPEHFRQAFRKRVDDAEVDVRKRRKALRRYMSRVVDKHRDVWAEATLAAALQLIVEDLGLRTVYYHTHDTGARLKAIHGCRPPKSLYSELPRRFCFTRTETVPEFLRRTPCKKLQYRLREKTEWFRLDFEERRRA